MPESKNCRSGLSLGTRPCWIVNDGMREKCHCPARSLVLPMLATSLMDNITRSCVHAHDFNIGIMHQRCFSRAPTLSWN